MAEATRARSRRVKKQLRDRRGRWIVEGGGITWTGPSGTIYTGKAESTDDEGNVEVTEIRYKDVNGRTGTLPQSARVASSKVNASPKAKARLDTASGARDEFAPVAEPTSEISRRQAEIIGALDLTQSGDPEDDAELQAAIASQNDALDILGDPEASDEDKSAAVDLFYEDIDALRAALAISDSGEPVENPLDTILGDVLDDLDEATLSGEDGYNPIRSSDTADEAEDEKLLDTDVASPTDDTPNELESKSGDVEARSWLKLSAVGARISFAGNDTTPPFIATKQNDGSWKIESQASDGDTREGGSDNSYAPDDDFFDQFFPVGLRIEKDKQ